jgi:hypothetical protein
MKTQTAWVAGVYEGEGSAFCRGANNAPTVSIGNADLEVLDRVSEWTGLGRIHGPYEHAGSKKPMYYWTVTLPEDIVRFFDMMWEWLSSRRREQADPVLCEARRRITKRLAKEDDRPAECGELPAVSSAGAQRHRKSGEKPCRQCALNERAYFRQQRQVKNYSQPPQEV